MKKKLTTKKKIIILEITGFFVTVIPIISVIVINRDRYFTTQLSTVRLGFGAVIAFILILLSALKKLKVPGKLTALAVIFVLSYLLEAMISDLTLIVGVALLGEVIDRIFIQSQINRLKENSQAEKTAETLSEKLEEVFKKYSGRV